MLPAVESKNVDKQTTLQEEHRRFREEGAKVGVEGGLGRETCDSRNGRIAQCGPS
jgi:hypothetical protein